MARHPAPAPAPVVTIGIDPHRGSHTAAALGADRRLLARLSVPADAAGYGRLRAWAARWPRRRWAVEGAGGDGRALAQWLLADGERVRDVPAKASARVRLVSAGHGRQTDAADAVSTALAACGPAALREATPENQATTLRLLSDHRDDLVARRTQARNRLHGLLAELAPGRAPARLAAARAAALLRALRPASGPARTRRRLAGELARGVRHLDTAVARAERELAAAARAAATGLTALSGIGPILAAKTPGRVGAVARFPTPAHVASYRGVAPLEASSGAVIRHRLARAGDRQPTFALHVMATCQARQHPAGRAYYLRKRAEGHSGLEALRCLKRRRADVVYRQPLRDAKRPAAAAA